MSGRPGPTLAIGGPTGTGKTMLAVELARRTGAELVNADLRQVLRRLVAGTARPTAAELGTVPCHLLDLCEPGEPFTAADWVRLARETLAGIEERGGTAIVVGGTGQYLRALHEGWDFGSVAPRAEQRRDLTAMAATADGLAELVAELRDRDPNAATSLDLANPRRVIRAIEVLRHSRGPLAAARGRSGARELALVVLDADRELHRAALQARIDAMFDGGAILEEVRAELGRGTAPAALRRAGIGYGEAVEVLDGALDVAGAKARAMQRTSRYVKAQRTWFRHEDAVLRLERRRGTGLDEVVDAVLGALAMPAGSPR